MAPFTLVPVRSQNVLVKHMKLNPCEKEDFELKMMLFDAIILLIKVPGSLEVGEWLDVCFHI